jgi:hypothetical protein
LSADATDLFHNIVEVNLTCAYFYTLHLLYQNNNIAKSWNKRWHQSGNQRGEYFANLPRKK